MTSNLSGSCELCGTPFVSKERTVAGRQRFCSKRCRDKADYERRRDAMTAELRARYRDDEAYRQSKIKRNREWKSIHGEGNRKPRDPQTRGQWVTLNCGSPRPPGG